MKKTFLTMTTSKPNSDILVSVICLTYNHSSFIKQCLDGFVMQETNFNYEVIIHDDASTDDTQDIIKEYAQKYTDIFVPILQKENQYSKHVQIGSTFIYPICRGKYVAFCEGDDYWTDPLKLQRQVDFLESHPEYGLIHTQAKEYIQQEGRFGRIIGKNVSSFEELLRKDTICTLTVMVRRELVAKYYEDINPSQYNWKMGDYPIWLYCSTKMKMHFLPEVTSVYRVLQSSMSHSLDPRKTLEFSHSIKDVKMFFANKEALPIAYKNIIDGEMQTEEICILLSISPKVAYDRLKQSNNITIKQKIYLYLKILQKIILR